MTEGFLLTFRLTLSQACPSGQTLTVPVDTRSFVTGQPTGTATEGTDYTRKTLNVAFSAGFPTKTFQVQTTQDAIDETNETFGVFLGAPTGTCSVSVTDGQGQGTIVDND